MESINGLEIINNTIFLATDNGLLKADILSNLKDPNSWALVSNDFDGPIGAMCQTNNGFAFTLNENIYKVFYNNGAIQYEQLDIQMPVNFTDMLFDEEEFVWGIHNRNVYSQKNDFVPITTGKTCYTISSDNQGNIIIGSELGLIVIDKISLEKNVYLASASPAIRYPNVYGIDMPSVDAFVAFNRTDEEIAEIIGADWLVYQDLDDLIDSTEAAAEITEVMEVEQKL